VARRTRVAACVAVGLVAMLSACGAPRESTGDGRVGPPTVTSPPAESGPVTPPSSAPPAPSEGVAAAGGRCRAADLSGAVAPSDAAAGNRYAELVVTNTSGRTCTLYGYGGLQLVDGAGRSTPTKLTREPNPGPSLVTLPPGGTAAKKLHWGVVPSGTEPVDGPCEPASAGARVIPPDDTTAFSVRFDFGSVCANGRVDGSAYFRK